MANELPKNFDEFADARRVGFLKMKELKMNIQFFASAVLREDAEALIEAQVSNEIIKGVIGQSAILKHAKRLPDMTSNETILNVEDVLPVAGFVNGDVGLKPTSDASWKNVKVAAEEIAVIIPFSENVLDDANYDLIGQLKPRIEEAFGKVIDGAGLFGVNIPVSWGQGLVQKATSAGNTVAYSADDTLYARIDKTMAKVEEDGFVANAILGSVKLKSGFRNMVDKNGQPIEGATSSILYEPDGLDLDAEYTVLLTRLPDNVSIMSCVADLKDLAADENDKVVVFEKNKVMSVLAPKAANVRVWTSTGILVKSLDVSKGENLVSTLGMSGVYILDFLFEDGTREIEQVVFE